VRQRATLYVCWANAASFKVCYSPPEKPRADWDARRGSRALLTQVPTSEARVFGEKCG